MTGTTGDEPRRPRVSRRVGWMGRGRSTLYGGGGRAGVLARGLARPLSAVWTWRALRRGAARPRSHRLGAPVISVGNVTVGGSGKTSIVQWLLADTVLDDLGVAVLSRGYGRRGRSVRVVAPGEKARPDEVGDEPLLHLRAGAWIGVGADRGEAAAAVRARTDVDVFVLDDGLQHPLERDLDIIVFAANDLNAPARCVPSGPLRQPATVRPQNGVWVVFGTDPNLERWPSGSIGEAFIAWWREIPGVLGEWRDLGAVALSGWHAGSTDIVAPDDRSAVVMTGVADPASVGRFAARQGWCVERVEAFPDHHRWTERDVERTVSRFPDASFLITEKDAVKMESAWFGSARVLVLRRCAEMRDAGPLRNRVRAVVRSRE